MPYHPINKCLPVTEDIRLQHRYSTIASDLSRKINFNKTEILRLLQMHHMLTTKRNRVMDELCFNEFMDIHLEFRNIDALQKIHILRCKTNKTHLTKREFVELLSLLLKGSLSETIRFCFEVYTEIIRSPMYIKKEDVLIMARKNSIRMSKLVYLEQYNRDFTEFVMEVMDKDRDTRISFEEYRNTVNENIGWLQFLGPILPSRRAIESFMKTFTSRPYVNTIEISAIEQYSKYKKKTAGTLQGDQSDLSLHSDSSLDTILQNDLRNEVPENDYFF